MNTLIPLVMLTVLSTHVIKAQNCDIHPYIYLKMSDVQAKVPESQKYEIIVKRQGSDPVNGAKIFADAAKGIYYAKGKDSLKWENVTTSKIKSIHHDFSEGTPLPVLNHFTYKSMSAPFMNEDFYKNIPQDQVDWAMMLLTDAFMMHEYKLLILDSLEFNRPYLPRDMSGNDIVMSGLDFNFASEYLQFLWDSFTIYNDKLCAVVRFESFFNLMGNRQSKGRSMYYGEMFISLDNKQIEYARMVEDVVLQQKESKEKWMDMQRLVVLNKVK
ncbi:MAG: hypothetical protein LBQ60_14230 [Bacteroidales bacterium]|jgi:hypothetical protein|nr:hypothetical protein [Bacteroidales bacterium]